MTTEAVDFRPAYLEWLTETASYSEPHYRAGEPAAEILRKALLRGWMNDETVEWMRRVFVANAEIAANKNPKASARRKHAVAEMRRMVQVIGAIIAPGEPAPTTNVQINSSAVLDHLRNRSGASRIIDVEGNGHSGNGSLGLPGL